MNIWAAAALFVMQVWIDAAHAAAHWYTMLQPLFALQVFTTLAQLSLTQATQPWQSAGPPPEPVTPAEPVVPADPVMPALPPDPPEPPFPPVPSPEHEIRKHNAETTIAARPSFIGAEYTGGCVSVAPFRGSRRRPPR
jgi:outer membrane biosynthesis protein TonB